MGLERRREARVKDTSATFVFDSVAPHVTCEVANLSRLGLGIRLPEQGELRTKLDALPVGILLTGTLRLHGEPFVVRVSLRVRVSSFVGLEYDDLDPRTAARIDALLTPKYIAASIAEVPPDQIGPEMDSAFVGNDFECLAFRPGVMASGDVFQVFAFGRMVEFSEGKARFVPAPLVRSQSKETRGMSMVSDFEAFSDSGGAKELREFLGRLAEITDEWGDCPAGLAVAISKLTKRNET